MKVVPLESPRKVAVVWEVGDCVALRSGGPILTVKKIIGESPVMVEVDWFDGEDDLHTAVFAKETLFSEKSPEWLN